MASHPDHPDWFEVRFTRKALDDWGFAYPHAPPGDEVVLWMQIQTCSRCGRDNKGGMGAIDPQGVTSEGLLYGDQLCETCIADETVC